MSAGVLIARALAEAHACGCSECKETIEIWSSALPSDSPLDSGRASEELPRSAEEHAP